MFNNLLFERADGENASKEAAKHFFIVTIYTVLSFSERSCSVDCFQGLPDDNFVDFYEYI